MSVRHFLIITMMLCWVFLLAVGGAVICMIIQEYAGAKPALLFAVVFGISGAFLICERVRRLL